MASRTDHRQSNDGDSLKNLKKEFDRRIQEISAEIVEGSSAATEESLDFLRNELERTFSEMRRQLEEAVEPGREAVRARPLFALGVALGLGVLIGVLLGRSSSRRSED